RRVMPDARKSFCVFEYIYFARPDSRMNGQALQVARGRMGEILARESPADADLVIPVPDIVGGKRLVVVDDSIVRGNTTRQIVQMLRDAGAIEVHMRISAPPIKHPCHYGIDMSTREEMIAHERSVEEIAAELGCD